MCWEAVSPSSRRKRSCGRTGSAPGGGHFPSFPGKEKPRAEPSKAAAGSPRSTPEAEREPAPHGTAAAAGGSLPPHRGGPSKSPQAPAQPPGDHLAWPRGEAGRSVRLTAWWPGSQLWKLRPPQLLPKAKAPSQGGGGGGSSRLSRCHGPAVLAGHRLWGSHFSVTTDRAAGASVCHLTAEQEAPALRVGWGGRLHLGVVSFPSQKGPNSRVGRCFLPAETQ